MRVLRLGDCTGFTVSLSVRMRIVMLWTDRGIVVLFTSVLVFWRSLRSDGRLFGWSDGFRGMKVFVGGRWRMSVRFGVWRAV